MPNAFVSYSWDSEEHRAWVRKLAEHLRVGGIESRLDQWHAVPGDSLPQFMETAIRESDFVIVICSAAYKTKSDNRSGGTGYEGDIMTGEAFVTGNRRKFVPVLRRGEWKDAGPSWLLGAYFVDLRGDDWQPGLNLLLDTLHKRLPEPPPVSAQGLKIRDDGDVSDAKTGLVWTNCRDGDLASLEDMRGALTAMCQKTGYEWRLPSESEVDEMRKQEEHYVRPPVMVKVGQTHPFFGKFNKVAWTEKRVANVRQGDQALTAGGVFDANRFAAGWSGLASILNVNSFQVAQEAETLRRRFPARFVRKD